MTVKLSINNKINSQTAPVETATHEERDEPSIYYRPLEVECKVRSDSCESIQVPCEYSPCSNSTSSTTTYSTSSTSPDFSDSSSPRFISSQEKQRKATFSSLSVSTQETPYKVTQTVTNEDGVKEGTSPTTAVFRLSPTPPQTMRKKLENGTVKRPVPSKRLSIPIYAARGLTSNTEALPLFESNLQTCQNTSTNPQQQPPVPLPIKHEDTAISEDSKEAWPGPSKLEWSNLLKQMEYLRTTVEKQNKRIEEQQRLVEASEARACEERRARLVLDTLLDQMTAANGKQQTPVLPAAQAQPEWAMRRQQELERLKKQSGSTNPFASPKNTPRLQRPTHQRRHSTSATGTTPESSGMFLGTPIQNFIGIATEPLREQPGTNPAAVSNGYRGPGVAYTCSPRIQRQHKRANSLSSVPVSPSISQRMPTTKTQIRRMVRNSNGSQQKGKGWRLCVGKSNQLWRELLVDGCGVDAQGPDGTWLEASVVKCCNRQDGEGGTSPMVLVHFVGHNSNEDRWFDRTSEHLAAHGSKSKSS